MNSIKEQEQPLWWIFISNILYFLINIDSFLAWIPSFLFLQVSSFFASIENETEKEKRFIYIQAIVGPHIYAGLIYYIYRTYVFDWRLLSALIFLYFACFLFQYRMDKRIDGISHNHLNEKRKVLKTLIIFKFIFTTWAFLTMGVFLSLP